MEKDNVKGNLKGWIIWGAVLLFWVLILTVPSSRVVFERLTAGFPYTMGFIKFAVLASMGDILGAKVLTGKWKMPVNSAVKAVIWGTIGMMVTLLFTLYNQGVMGAMVKGLLPFEGSKFFTAFFTSAVMNTTFGPTMYLYHKLMDTWADLSIAKKRRATVKEVTDSVDWNTFLGFSLLKTLPFVWIPLHTMVFFLPPQFRVVASAFLSIVLGLLVALSRRNR